MSSTTDIQYGPEVAGLYDAIIGDVMPTAESLYRCAEHFRGRRVVDLGVGTGRMAIPLASIASEIVGIDNSDEMLDRLHAKQVPANVTTRRADLRDRLPFDDGRFTGAISTLGSFACVRTHGELAHAMREVARVLEPGSVFALDYYRLQTYRQLEPLGCVSVDNPLHPSRSEMTVSVHEPTSGDLTLSVQTTVIPHDGSESTSFAESVLVMEPPVLVDHADRAGFELIEFESAGDGGPFDWYLLRRKGH